MDREHDTQMTDYFLCPFFESSYSVAVAFDALFLSFLAFSSPEIRSSTLFETLRPFQCVCENAFPPRMMTSPQHSPGTLF